MSDGLPALSNAPGTSDIYEFYVVVQAVKQAGKITFKQYFNNSFTILVPLLTTICLLIRPEQGQILLDLKLIMAGREKLMQRQEVLETCKSVLKLTLVTKML